MVSDTGAFASLGGPVLERACTHAAGPYAYENFEIEGRAYYTNNPPAGAFRGFGVTQTCFCTETLLNEMADLVGISELDSCTVRTGRVFQLKKFAELMGKEWSYEYSRAMAYQGGAYGDGIASREKPVRAFAAPLPKGDGAEPRVMVVMEFEKYVFATTHLDHVSSLAQAGQVDEINKVIEREFGGSKKPVFLGGDFNARPDSPTISKLKTDWTILTPHGASDFTHSSQAPDKCIDYILLWNGNGAKCEVVGTKIMLDFNKGDIKRASDHIPVLVDVKF